MGYGYVAPLGAISIIGYIIKFFTMTRLSGRDRYIVEFQN